jgi:Type I restriction enzyme R protein N terminus (HSDR_N)
MPLPARLKDRLTTGLKRLVPIIAQQKTRDVSEPDTVTLVKDLLCDVFGYDKYAELTSEHAIRGTYCDLAVKLSDKLSMLIEVKSAGTPLDDRHVKQAVDYGSNQGCEWIVLTNASQWRLYQVIFAKPIDKRLVAEIDLTTIEPRKEESLEKLWPLTKEGFLKGAHVELRDRQDATSRYVLSALLTCNETVIGAIRRELRRVVNVMVDDTEIVAALQHQVIKRDTLEGPEAEAACRRVNRNEGKAIRKVKELAEVQQAEDQDASRSDPATQGSP